MFRRRSAARRRQCSYGKRRRGQHTCHVHQREVQLDPTSQRQRGKHRPDRFQVRLRPDCSRRLRGTQRRGRSPHDDPPSRRRGVFPRGPRPAVLVGPQTNSGITRCTARTSAGGFSSDGLMAQRCIGSLAMRTVPRCCSGSASTAGSISQNPSRWRSSSISSFWPVRNAQPGPTPQRQGPHPGLREGLERPTPPAAPASRPDHPRLRGGPRGAAMGLPQRPHLLLLPILCADSEGSRPGVLI